MVQLLGRQVITPGRIPLGALQLKIFPFATVQLPAKTLVGPETDPWQVVPVVETKNTASLHDDRINAAGDASSGGLPVAQPSSASRSERLGPQPMAPPSGEPPSGDPPSGAPASGALVCIAGNPRAASVCE
ncbi:MAG TPA: hypothetical protein VG496_17255 [Myxococcales bacterium]|nr:hypothetical protein [Myxococcales bacterium]